MKTDRKTAPTASKPKAVKKKARAVPKPASIQIGNLLERINDGIVVFDAEMNYVYVNKRGGELLGRKAKDLIGKNYWVEYPEAKDTPFAKAYVRALETQETIVLEDYYAPFDRWFENRIYPSKEGLTIFFTEITGRKKAEQVVRESQERLALAIRSANVGLWDWDLQTNKVQYSPEWKSQLGYEDREISDDFSEWESHVHPEDLERAKATVGGYIEKPYPNFHNEFRMRHKDGLYRWILAQASLLCDERGKPIRMIGSHIDITERKWAEEKLRLSEEQFSKAFFASPAGLTITRIADGKFIDVNESFLRMFEFSREEALGHTSTELNMWTPEERKKLIQHQLESGGLHDFELQARAKSGRIVYILFSSKPMDLAGEACHITTMIDITERKRAEDALQRSEQTYSVIFKKAPFAAGLTNIPDGTYLEANEEFERVFGFSREEIVGKTSLELGMYPDPQTRERSAVMFKEQSFVRNLDARLQTRSGETRDVLINSDLVEIGGEKYILTTANDITERKRAQEELQRGEQVLRLFVEHSPAAIAMFDREMKYIVASRRYLIDYELGEQNVVGRSHYEIFPEIPERWKEIHRRCLAGATERNEEDPFPRASGKLDWVRWEIRPWYESSGEIGGIILFSEVITERKQAQEEIRLSRDRLAELSRQLVETHETESRAIGRELHDQIGQMLTALKLTLEIASQLPADKSAQKLAGAQELLDDLMNRVSALSLELRPPMLDDLGLVPALLWHVNRFQEQTQIEVDFHHSGVEGKRFGPEIETTAYRVVQEAFTNVVRHARATRIRIEVRAGGGQMEIQIEDNGTGFDPRAAFAKHRGLSATRERVQLLGGAFQVESQIGKGARKIIRLPLKEDP